MKVCEKVRKDLSAPSANQGLAGDRWHVKPGDLEESNKGQFTKVWLGRGD